MLGETLSEAYLNKGWVHLLGVWGVLERPVLRSGQIGQAHAAFGAGWWRAPRSTVGRIEYVQYLGFVQNKTLRSICIECARSI